MDYILIRSRRKTLSLSLTPEGVVVRAPMRLARKHIDEFVESRAGWIAAHTARMEARERELAAVRPMTEAELEALKARALPVFTQRAARFAPMVGVKYGRVSVRTQKTRWGSCSGRGDLSFNALLLLAPPEVLDSVVVHELCHILEPNHSPRFYAQVLRVCPDYYAAHAWLKENGAALTRRLPAREGAKENGGNRGK